MRRSSAISIFLLVFVAGIACAALTMSDAVMQKFAEQEQYYQLPSGILAKIAQIESGGNTASVNGGTQAGGLFQWIPRYWYNAASKLYPANSGALDPQSRFNPFIATEVTAFNLSYVRSVIGGQIAAAHADMSVGLYMGHFLGAGGAGRFFALMAQNPNAPAVTYFPKEAAANSSVFSGRTIAGVYNYFAAKMQSPGITGVSNYAGVYTGPTAGRIMDQNGNVILAQQYTAVPPPANFQTYPTTYNLTQDTAFANATPTVPPPISNPGGGGATGHGGSALFASNIIAQPHSIHAGESVLVSWTSVGMAGPCSVFIGTSQLVAGAAEGSKSVTDYPATGGTVTFTLQCPTPAGTNDSKTVSVTVN